MFVFFVGQNHSGWSGTDAPCDRSGLARFVNDNDDNDRDCRDYSYDYADDFAFAYTTDRAATRGRADAGCLRVRRRAED